MNSNDIISLTIGTVAALVYAKLCTKSNTLAVFESVGYSYIN